MSDLQKEESIKEWKVIAPRRAIARDLGLPENLLEAEFPEHTKIMANARARLALSAPRMLIDRPYAAMVTKTTPNNKQTIAPGN